MSGLEGIADELAQAVHVADVPLADIGLASHRGVLKWLELTMVPRC